MTHAALSLAYEPRLRALAAMLNRKPIVRRMAVPAGIELHSFEWAILRGQWRKHFGQGAMP